MKQLLTLMMAYLMAVSLSVPAFAANKELLTDDTTVDNNDNSVVPFYVGTQTDHSWSYSYGKPTEKTKGSWTHFYTGDPAKRDGEYDTASHSVSYSSTFSGAFGGNIKSKIQIEFGISFSKSEEFAISKNSAPLKKGEYIKAYWIKNFDSYDVTQKDLKHIYGFKQQYPGGPYVKVNTYDTDISHVTVDKALELKIRIEYWKDGKKIRFADTEDSLERIEYYEWKNGAYQMTYGED